MAEKDFFYVRHTGPEVEDETNVGETENSEVNLDEVISKIEAERKIMVEKIGKTIVKRHFSCGVWDEKTKLVKITKQKGLNQYQPERNVLKAFEALFYMECRTLSVQLNGKTLTIQDAYRTFLNTKCEQQSYTVFAQLSRLGYYVHTVTQQQQRFNNEIIEKVKQNCNKKIKTSKENELLTVRDNQNPIITNVRPLTINHMRKLNRFDRKLFSNSNSRPQEYSESIIYNVQQSSNSEIPEEFPPFNNCDVKPLLSLGETPTCEELFSKLQASGPKEYSKSENLIENSKINFNVYKNRKASKDGEILFNVIICEPHDRIPTFENIPHDSADVPLLYCMINDQMECGFFKLSSVKLEDKIPILWRALGLETL